MINYYGSCDSSFRRTHSIFHALLNTDIDHNVHRNWFLSILSWLYTVYWCHEQLGSLQLWAHSKKALLHLPSFKISHVHTFVSLLPFALLLWSQSLVHVCNIYWPSFLLHNGHCRDFETYNDGFKTWSFFFFFFSLVAEKKMTCRQEHGVYFNSSTTFLFIFFWESQ